MPCASRSISAEAAASASTWQSIRALACSELYVAAESAPVLYAALHNAADPPGGGGGGGGGERGDGGVELRDGGYYAMDSLRIEAGYRAWGHELGVSDTPLEAGLGFTLDWSKEFLGRHALEKQRADPAARRQRLVCLHLPEASLPLWGSEPILRDGVPLGNVTSAGYAHGVGGQLAMGYLAHADAGARGFVESGAYQLDVGGTLLDAAASTKPFFDAQRRVRGEYGVAS